MGGAQLTFLSTFKCARYRGAYNNTLLFKSCFPEAQIGPVTYSEENTFPEIRLFEEATLSVIKITMTKSIHWKYEEEYRIVKHGAGTKVHFPSEAVREIILGCNISEKDSEEIVNLAKLKFPACKLLKANMSLQEFKLEFVEL